MVLSYKCFFDKEKKLPTSFREKILLGLQDIHLHGLDLNYTVPIEPYQLEKIWSDESHLRPKFHTLREDPHNRWKPTRLIQHAYFPRTVNYQCFLENRCISIQRVEIRHLNPRHHLVMVDGRRLSFEEVLRLARNDGFEGHADFFRWFDCDWKGKLIHWTDLRY